MGTAALGCSAEQRSPISRTGKTCRALLDRTAEGGGPHAVNCKDTGSSLDVAGCQSPFFQILLMIVLGGMERHRRNNLGHDRLLEAA